MPKKKKFDPILYIAIPGILLTVAVIEYLLDNTTIGIIILEGFIWFICTFAVFIAGLINRKKIKKPKIWIPILTIIFITGIYSIIGPIKDVVSGSEMTTFTVSEKKTDMMIEAPSYVRYYIVCSPLHPIPGDGLQDKTKFRVPKEVFDKVEEGSEYILTYYRNIKVATKAKAE